MSKTYKQIIICHFCGETFEVEFLLPPNDEEKQGWICEDCAKEFKKETDYSPLISRS